MTIINVFNNIKDKIKNKFYYKQNILVENIIKDLGFQNVTKIDSPHETYERYNEEYNYTQVVILIHKQNGKHILQSYDKELFAYKDGATIGNCCVGLTYTELMAFTMKMKLLGLKS